VLNAYFKLISAAYEDVYVYSTFFYSKLASSGYEAVKHWTKKNLLCNRLLLFPIHLDVHWCLAAANPTKQQIVYYDSLQGYNADCARHLCQYMEQVSAGTEYSDSQWTFSSFANTPKQQNSSDCGVFICALARCLAANQPFSFTQNDISCIRKHIILELYSQKLLP